MEAILKVDKEIIFFENDMKYQSMEYLDFFYFPVGIESMLNARDISYIEMDYEFPVDDPAADYLIDEEL